MSDFLTILEEAEGTAVLTLNRPEKRNALSRALRQEIVERLDELAKSDDVRAVVLTGAAPVFCAGPSSTAAWQPASTCAVSVTPTFYSF